MPMLWVGMNVSAWFRLLAKNRGRLDQQRRGALLMVTVWCIFNSAARMAQWLLVGWRVRRNLDQPPLFVLGHWRTGTTLLHELMVLDSRHTYPTTYQCFQPNHFLITEGLTKWLASLMPARRAMDNMPAGWHRPQEDEFALCGLGAPSPYLTMAFPNGPPQDQVYLTLEGLPAKAVARWKRTFRRFLSEVGHRAKGRQRIVLKSPPHTGRVKVLLEMYPDAKFVHIVRDPSVVFPSTVHLWKTLYPTLGLQKPDFVGLEERVFENLTEMYRRFDQDRSLIPEGNFCELHYEKLVADPTAEMERVYEALGLGGFDAVRPALEVFAADMKGYETNRYPELVPELRRRIAERWRWYAQEYGYSQPSAVAAD